MTTEELDALDRRVAELRGWKWEDDEKIKLSTGYLYLQWQSDRFFPTRDARQAMVLLEEGGHGSELWCQQGVWYCEIGPTKPDGLETSKANSPCEAIVRAWIVWKEANNEV